MMVHKSLWLLLLQVCWLIPAVSYSMPLPATGAVTIIIQPTYNGEPLVLTDKYYVNSNGDTLYIDLFKFYITNFSLNGTVIAADNNSHLVDAEHAASCNFNVPAATGQYTTVQFTAGVDSIANTSGANSGDLDPSKGMYWAWNTGYIMAKLEGRSNVCRTLHHAFEFHIGGYMPPYNAARAIGIALPHSLNVTTGHTTITIKADAAVWFSNISLAQTNSIVIPGKQACAMADNYAKMFFIASVKTE